VIGWSSPTTNLQPTNAMLALPILIRDSKSRPRGAGMLDRPAFAVAVPCRRVTKKEMPE